MSSLKSTGKRINGNDNVVFVDFGAAHAAQSAPAQFAQAA